MTSAESKDIPRMNVLPDASYDARMAQVLRKSREDLMAAVAKKRAVRA